MTDYVIALRHPCGLVYYRDDAGRFWSGEPGIARAQRFPTLEVARETVLRGYSIDAQRRFSVVPLSSVMGGMLAPTALAVA